MLTYVKLFLYVISTLGLWEAVHRRFNRIDIAFVPGITVAAQTTLLFFAGLLNILPEMVYCLYAVGFLSLIVFIYRDKSIRLIRQYLKPAFLFLGVLMILLGLYLKGKIFTDYDNFSHWALVVRRMLTTNRFPNYKDPVIFFQEYPIGSGVYIYYVSKLVGTSESIQMLAQQYMIVVSIMALFALCKKGWPLVMLILVSYANYAMIYIIANGVTSLLVDALLPIVSMAGLLYALLYCKNAISGIDYLPSAFYLIQIAQIKNSGIFFVAIIVVLLLTYTIRSKSHIPGIAGITAPFLSVLLWHKHCNYVFDSSETSKHAMTLKNYSQVFQSKSSEDIKLILSKFVSFLFTWKDFWLTVGAFLVVLIIVLIIHKKRKKHYFRIMPITISMFIAYQIGICAMYIVSMPGWEATTLTQVDRYAKTIILALLYLLLVPIIELISSNYSRRKLKAIIVAVLATSMIFAHMKISLDRILWATRDSSASSPATRNWFEQAKTDHDLPDGESYTALIPQPDNNYVLFICRYVFQSPSVNAIVVESAEDMDSINSKYILVYDSENTVAREWIQAHYPDQAGSSVITTQ